MGLEDRLSQDLVVDSKPIRQEFIIPLFVRKGIGRVLEYILYAILIVIFSIPFVWMILSSVRDQAEIFANLYPFGWHTLVPIEWTLKNFADVFGLSEEGRSFGLNFDRFLVNSLIVSVGVVASSLIFNTMGAYFFCPAGISLQKCSPGVCHCHDVGSLSSDDCSAVYRRHRLGDARLLSRLDCTLVCQPLCHLCPDAIYERYTQRSRRSGHY